MSDTWDSESTYTRAPVLSSCSSSSKPKISAPIPDDWDADDDYEEEVESPHAIEERNKQIWEDANTKIHRPMPSLVISRGSSSTSTIPSLPLNQPPPMRILKRPSPALSPSQSSSSVNSTAETLQEREARYQAARERIFGTPTPDRDASESGDKKQAPGPLNSPKSSSPRPTLPAPTLPPSTKIVREPHGPINIAANKGFQGREVKKPPALTATTSSTPDRRASNIPIS